MGQIKSVGTKSILLLLIGTGVTGLAYSDDNAVKKFRNFTPQQIQALPDKVKTSELPMMYSFAARTGLAPDAGLLFSMQLNRLMYPAAGNYMAAVRA